jgi:hypothetical protein
MVTVGMVRGVVDAMVVAVAVAIAVVVVVVVVVVVGAAKLLRGALLGGSIDILYRDPRGAGGHDSAGGGLRCGYGDAWACGVGWACGWWAREG